MSRINNWLTSDLMISDGAWGTQLQARGLPSGTIPDTWNLTHRDKVEEVAGAYVDAGSQVILTNTFRANAVAMHGFAAAELDSINRAGVAISKKAAGTKALVFASIGPTGKILMSGEVSAEQVRAAFSAQAESLAAGGADALLIETMSEIDEARLAVEAARRTGLPVLASFAFDSGKNKDRTMMGATPETIAAAMVEAGADAVGANCGVGVELSVPICARLHAACDLPIWIKPNAGLPIIEGTAIRYETSAEYFASHYAALASAGASFVGSCCGSTPEFIRTLVAAGLVTK
ncbi:MAG TPA: homocysteine S-methyltransferase family protein [Terracidiphilus sp.]|nr:homocysteine S-methyltransferase family protein [Terracidiphilus sp.]